MSAFDDYVEHVKGLFVQRHLAVQHLPVRGRPSSRTRGRVDSGSGGIVRFGPDPDPVDIVLKQKQACFRFAEEVEIVADGGVQVSAYTYEYMDWTYSQPVRIRFENDQRGARPDHPRHHAHVEPFPHLDVRLPTGEVKLEQVLDLIAQQFGAGE